MTALQELANLKGELDRIKAEAGLNAQAATDATNLLATVTAERDALTASNAALVSERDTLKNTLTVTQTAAVSVETRAAAIAVQQLSAVGAAPVGAAPVTASADFVTQMLSEKDPVKRTALFRQNRVAIRASFNAQKLASN